MTRLVIAAVAVTGLVAVALFYLETEKRAAAEEAREDLQSEINDATDTIEDAADAAARARRDCHEFGGVFDFANGECLAE